MSLKHVSSVFRKGLFKHKVAIVTGGATGIGKAITEELIYLGCKVVIASRNEERLTAMVNETSEQIEKSTPPQIMSVKCNIRNEDEVKHLMEVTLKTYGKLDFLVNNGGGQFLSPAADISKKGWNAVIETNLTGTFFMCQEAYHQWMKDNKGSIVNIIMNYQRGVPMMAHSGAARAAVQNLTQTLSVEWAQDGVRVNAVAPGHSIYSDTAEKNYQTDVFSLVKEHIPSRRCGTPQEISAAVCFLLSPAASFVTGETIFVDCAERWYSPVFYKIPEHNNLPPFGSSKI